MVHKQLSVNLRKTVVIPVSKKKEPKTKQRHNTKFGVNLDISAKLKYLGLILEKLNWNEYMKCHWQNVGFSLGLRVFDPDGYTLELEQLS